VLGLTAIGQVAPGSALPRTGARPGDEIWVSGSIGDAGLGLAMARGVLPLDTPLRNRFRRPTPRLALGRALAGVASAAMDVSDGLLIDADRLGRASGVRLDIAIDDVPVAAAWTQGLADRLARVTAGDDYELLFTAAPGSGVAAAAAAAKTPVTRIGTVTAGLGVRALTPDGSDVTPARLGWEH
jgi:thiamine-monophosphate kinase